MRGSMLLEYSTTAEWSGAVVRCRCEVEDFVKDAIPTVNFT